MTINAINSYKFDCPVIIDLNYEFKKLNPHIPENYLYHTFLLDTANNVILVGNPTNNGKIMNVLYEKVTGSLKKNVI